MAVYTENMKYSQKEYESVCNERNELAKENRKLKRLVELWKNRHLALNELYNEEHGFGEDYIKKVCE